jgi:hypothetical protein
MAACLDKVACPNCGLIRRPAAIKIHLRTKHGLTKKIDKEVI